MSLVISLLVLVVLVLTGVYISWRAGRLDRLHTRLETATASLDAALVRRSSVTLELAASGLFDPATSLLLGDCAHTARSAQTGREMAESDLTRTLRTVITQPDFGMSLAGTAGADELLSELEATAQGVFIARKFYNDAVAATISARRRWLARVLRLAGGAPMPEFFEIDDNVGSDSVGEQGTDMPHLAG
jgi:hypothetical protein